MGNSPFELNTKLLHVLHFLTARLSATKCIYLSAHTLGFTSRH